MICAGEELRAALAQAGDRILLHDMAGQTRTGRQLVENVDRLAGALVAEGLSGGAIGLWYRNSLAAVEAFLAVEWVGGTRVPLDPNAPPGEAEEVFKAAGVDIILTDRAHRATLSRALLVHDDDAPLAGRSVWPRCLVQPDKTLLLYPRAVTNGQLFGVPVSYGNWRASMQTNIALYRAGRYGPWHGGNECFLTAQQLMHGTSFVGAFPFLEMGLPQVLVDSFEATRVLDAIDRHRVTATVLVPAMMRRLVDAALERPGSGSSLRHLIYGGAPVAADEIRRTMRRFGPVLVQGYGRIEGGWPISILGVQEHLAILGGDDDLVSSCGRAVDGIAVKLRPVDGAAPDCGELCVAGETTVKEYTGPDGWCSLGDLVHMDQKGYLFHRGRLDRMINTGYHVYPSEVEEAIMQVPGVVGALVTGVASNSGSVTLTADIVLASGTQQQDVITRVSSALAGRLANYKIPRNFRIVEQLS